jgi:phosphoribosylformylglycinamidine synthase
MKFSASIDIMPQKELLDPQGKTVGNNLKNIGLDSISEVRIGKHITLQVEAQSKEAAEALVEAACKKLLANLIMETFTFRLVSQE